MTPLSFAPAFVHAERRRRRRAARWAGRALAFAWSGLFWLIVGWAAMAGSAMAQTTIRDAEIERAVRDYADPIIRAARLDPKEIDIVIVQDPSINAFVTSSRSMFIHTGLITAAENPNELKGVIAHETGHMAGGHPARTGQAIERAMRPAYLSIGLGILAIAAGAPDAGAALIAGSQQFAYGSFVQHTQAQESSADQAAVTFMEASGQSAEGLLTFADRQFRYNEMRNASRIPAWMRTHPLWSDRIQALRGRVAAAEHRERVDSAAEIHRYTLLKAKLYGYLEHANRVTIKYPEKDQSDAARYARAIAFMRSSDFPRAEREARSLLQEFPANPYFAELMGEIMFSAGKFDESATYHRRSLELLPNHPLLEINLARALIASQKEDRLPEAIDLLQAALRQESDNATAWYELSQAYDRRGEEGLARLASAELRFAVGDYAGARSFAERAKERLSQGTPSWRRALDISVISSAQIDSRRS